MVNRRPGRPSQPSNTRARILEAARNRFEAEGYTRTSLRSIAREADVDHALVTYYFGSKEGLFRAVTRLALSPAQGFDTVAARVAPEYLAEALLRAALALWDRPEYRTGLVRLFTSALASESALRILREYLHSEVVKHLTDHIQGPDAEQRAGAAAAIISGLFLTRHLLQLEPVASLPPEEIIAQLAPALRTTLHPRPVRARHIGTDRASDTLR